MSIDQRERPAHWAERPGKVRGLRKLHPIPRASARSPRVPYKNSQLEVRVFHVPGAQMFPPPPPNQAAAAWAKGSAASAPGSSRLRGGNSADAVALGSRMPRVDCRPRGQRHTGRTPHGAREDSSRANADPMLALTCAGQSCRSSHCLAEHSPRRSMTSPWLGQTCQKISHNRWRMVSSTAATKATKIVCARMDASQANGVTAAYAGRGCETFQPIADS